MHHRIQDHTRDVNVEKLANAKKHVSDRKCSPWTHIPITFSLSPHARLPSQASCYLETGEDGNQSGDNFKQSGIRHASYAGPVLLMSLSVGRGGDDPGAQSNSSLTFVCTCLSASRGAGSYNFLINESINQECRENKEPAMLSPLFKTKLQVSFDKHQS